ncbi:hypothetical protein [Nocardia stercoris]|uniref:Uncharacterized protein n=1 Tax=Nocardia stercoris TaxID=2483361 RepID=A0A3M2KV26_9NOCA|nr:hypothetical protein [Nocardia stercoris]RMI28854.1 hypothetical protein EBN03_28695 [Nocardia stercoris]
MFDEQLTSALYLDQRKDIDPYRLIFDGLSIKALTPDQSMKRLRSISDDLLRRVRTSRAILSTK